MKKTFISLMTVLSFCYAFAQEKGIDFLKGVRQS